MKGLAGRPELAMIGQFAMQSLLVNVVGSVTSQQSTIPHAYLIAVGTAPFNGERSTVIADDVAPAAMVGRFIHPSLNCAGSLVGVAPPPPNDGNRPFQWCLVEPGPSPPAHVGQ